MKNSSKISLIIAVILLVTIIIVTSIIIYLNKTNNKNDDYSISQFEIQLHEEQLEVEEICNNVIELYEIALNEYLKNPTEENKEKVNKTAEAYNNYISEKKYVWGGKVPPHIVENLSFVG